MLISSHLTVCVTPFFSKVSISIRTARHRQTSEHLVPPIVVGASVDALALEALSEKAPPTSPSPYNLFLNHWIGSHSLCRQAPSSERSAGHPVFASRKLPSLCI
mmetsp:Transcript_45554/g.113227  ORF Transcript_45554/g.113227 Transcript_45554/m.113227 type:complete len:104 (-) Transcript_45554:336-647(-)